jgi:hypothetical protein
MLEARVQHSTPGPTLLQDGRAMSPWEKLGEQEYCGMKPRATAEQMMTPMGWKTDRQARRKRLF